MTKLRVAAWIGVAATLAVLTAGAIFGLSAESRADEINRRLSFVDMNNQPHKFDAEHRRATCSRSSPTATCTTGSPSASTRSPPPRPSPPSPCSSSTPSAASRHKEHAWHVAPVVGKNAGGFALGGSF